MGKDLKNENTNQNINPKNNVDNIIEENIQEETSTKKKDNNIFLWIGVAVVAIVVIIAFLFVGNKEETPTQANPEVLEDLEFFDYEVEPGIYAVWKENGNSIDLSRANYIDGVRFDDEIMQNFRNVIGKEFLESFKVSTTDGAKVEILPGTNKLLVFTTAEDDNLENLIAQYLYLGALAKDDGVYEVYVIDTNPNTMGDFMDRFNAYIWNNPRPEEIDFLETYPDDFILYIDDTNVIQCITEMRNPNIVSKTAAYVFSGTVPMYKLIRNLEYIESNPDEANKEYFTAEYSNDTEVIEFIGVFNDQNGYNFLRVDNENLLNDEFASAKEHTYISGILTSYFDVPDSKRTYVIKQGLGSGQFLGLEGYEYVNTKNIGDIYDAKFYGNSQDEIFEFVFLVDNMKLLISSNEPWTLAEAEAIVKNF